MPESSIAEPRPRGGIRRVSFHTLGCKLNQAETAGISREFRRRGYQVVPFRQQADLTFINTCTVTNEADAKSRQAVRQAVKASPHGRIIAAGCYAQVAPGELAALEGVDVVLGTGHKQHVWALLDLLEGGKLPEPLVRVGDQKDLRTWDEAPFMSESGPDTTGDSPAPAGRSRAFLKVQEGCSYQCSYCIIPLARGPGRSRPLERCLTEARRMVSEGYREIVVTGVNIGTWQWRDLQFHDLLAALSDVEGLRRLRVSSIEPNLVSEELLRLVAERDNIAPHLHVPLQHAADRVLKAMRRRYLFRDYLRVMERIMAAVPDAAIGADVIVGFPGETEDEFRQLAQALATLPLTYHHVFRYSERDGTLAAAMGAPVDPMERKRRGRVLREISRKRRREVARRFSGQTRLVHFERPVGTGRWEGLTDNYLRVRAPLPAPPGDPFQLVLLTGPEGRGLRGRLASVHPTVAA
ncbi:MAG: tRNA (N(6)-L-threonylcarbamoyladenosine(37)-C(2))-methylthiotransferase MtaB [Candidatus Neomarinimicrobiota bacterium]